MAFLAAALFTLGTSVPVAEALSVVLESGSASVSIMRSNGETASQTISGGSYPHIMGKDIARAAIGPFGGPVFSDQHANAGAAGRTPIPEDFFTHVVAEVGLMEAGTTAEATSTFSYLLSGVFAPGEVARFLVTQNLLQILVLGEGIGVNPTGAGEWGVDAYAQLHNSVEFFRGGDLVWSSALAFDSLSLPLEVPAQRRLEVTAFPEFQPDPITGELNLRLIISSSVAGAVANRDLYRFQAQVDAGDVVFLGPRTVPEPPALVLLCGGLAALGVLSWRRHRSRVRDYADTRPPSRSDPRLWSGCAAAVSSGDSTTAASGRSRV